MKALLSNRWVILTLRLILGGVFLYAGIGKTLDPQSFADSIATLKVMPPSLLNIVAIALPVLEVVAGMMLIGKLFLRQGAFVILVLTGIFAFGIIQALARGLEIDCGCFGSGEPSILKSWFSLARDLLLFAGAAIVYRKALHSTGSVTSARKLTE